MPRRSDRLALALGLEIIEQIHRRVVSIAREKHIVRGRRVRVDTTVVETDIHYPTNGSLHRSNAAENRLKRQNRQMVGVRGVT
jgi:hypothetical protein